ncbi:MAG: addiction module protein [Patescibacteria group bacterium]
MEISTKQVVLEALKLPPLLRAFVAEKIIESLDEIQGPDLSQEWKKVIARRCQEIDQNLVELKQAESVFERAYSKLG